MLFASHQLHRSSGCDWSRSQTHWYFLPLRSMVISSIMPGMVVSHDLLRGSFVAQRDNAVPPSPDASRARAGSKSYDVAGFDCSRFNERCRRTDPPIRASQSLLGCRSNSESAPGSRARHMARRLNARTAAKPSAHAPKHQPTRNAGGRKPKELCDQGK